MNPLRHDYFAFLLRVWRADEDGAAVWRASLENPHTGERLAFSTLAQLAQYLQQQTEHGGANGDGSPRP